MVLALSCNEGGNTQLGRIDARLLDAFITWSYLATAGTSNIWNAGSAVSHTIAQYTTIPSYTEAHTTGEGSSKESPQMGQMICIQSHTELCTGHVTNCESMACNSLLKAIRYRYILYTNASKSYICNYCTRRETISVCKPEIMANFG